MSYILDALKKSDKERKRGTVPDLSTVQDPFQQKRKKRSLWPYLVLIALLINAGIFLSWLRSWETGDKATPEGKEPHFVTHNLQSKTAPMGSSENQSTSRATKSPETVQSAPSVTTTPQDKSPHTIQSTMPPEKPDDTNQKQQMIPTPPHVIQKDITLEKPSQNLPETPAPSLTAPNPPHAGTNTLDQQKSPPQAPSGSRFILYDLKDLPQSVKDQLPDIAISVFVYSDDPSSRIVKINGKTVREGQELAEGLSVEKIVPEGVIFHYGDYRFRIVLR